MAYGVKLSVSVDEDKLAASVQRAMSRGFGGGGAQGLATSPDQMVRNIMGNMAQGMRGHGTPLREIMNPTHGDVTGGRGNAFFFQSRMPPNIAAFQAAAASASASRNFAQQAAFLKNMGFAGIPLLSPGSLLGNLFATRQIFSGLSGPVGQGLLGKIGVGGTAATAAATGGIMAILLAVGTALKGLEAAIRGTIRAYDEARRLYAKSLLSGLGTQFTVGRANLASVLGVSEEQVYQFGAAIGILGPKLKFASDVMARTTPNLTSVSWEFEILKKNLEALFFDLADKAAPALRLFTAGLSTLINGITGFVDTVTKYISAHPWLQKIIGGAVSGIGGQALIEIINAGKANYMGAAQNPSGMMKQLPVSAFERMGLVVGGFGGGQDYARRTAKASEETNKILKAAMAGAKAGGAGSFFSPQASNP